MAVTVWKTCGTVSTTASPGSAEDWDVVNTQYYSMNIYAGYSLTGYLILKNFGFTTSDIPTGSTIDGIEVSLFKDSANGQVGDYFIKLTTDGTNPIGTDQAIGGYWSSSWAYYTYGGSTNKWGTSVTDSQIRSSSFGFVLQAYFNAYVGINFAYVETNSNTQIRVYYTPPSTSSGIHYKDNTTWRDVSTVYYKDGTTWITITNVYYKDGTTWRELS